MSIFVFGYVRYSDPDKILRLNVKCCLDGIKMMNYSFSLLLLLDRYIHAKNLRAATYYGTDAKIRSKNSRNTDCISNTIKIIEPNQDHNLYILISLSQ